MGNLSSTDEVVTKNDLKDFYSGILPYLGGSGGGDGHIIKDSDDTEMTPRAGLKFSGDLEVSDDSENDETEVAPHRLTSEELADICSPLPASTSNLPVLFDESGAEYVVGRYVNSQGKWKPVYRKDIVGSVASSSDVIDISDLGIDNVIKNDGVFVASDGYTVNINRASASSALNAFYVDWHINPDKTSLTIATGTSYATGTYHITLEYTKTTDTYRD